MHPDCLFREAMGVVAEETAVSRSVAFYHAAAAKGCDVYVRVLIPALCRDTYHEYSESRGTVTCVISIHDASKLN